MKNIMFNANHSPIGAYASFTLGFPGAAGGPGMERRGPADTNVYIGVERREGGSYESFPFFKNEDDESKQYDVEKEDTQEQEGYFDLFPASEIERDFRVSSDSWKAKDITFTLYNQVESIPDPKSCVEECLKEVIVPAVLAELSIDNRGCPNGRKAFFGFNEVEERYGMRPLSKGAMHGVGQGGNLAGFIGAGCTCGYKEDLPFCSLLLSWHTGNLRDRYKILLYQIFS